MSKIFISWSGERSHQLAEALHGWIPLVLHYVEPWLSQADIEAGQRWADEVAKELETRNFGIICVTKENVNSPWVLFESGALAKSMQGSRVIPLLLDHEFKDISGPLAQFQAKKVDRTGMNDVVQSLNQVADHPIPEDRVKQLFEALWPELEKKITTIPKTSGSTKPSRSQSDILEELVAGIRSLDSKFRDIAEEGPRSFRQHKSKMNPMMIHELSQMIGEKTGDPVNILILASYFREEMPWFYELGMEAYRSVKNGNQNDSIIARKHLKRALHLFRQGVFPVEEIGIDPGIMFMIIREMDSILHNEPDPSDPPIKKIKRRKSERSE
jgi:hypothetical protein